MRYVLAQAKGVTTAGNEFAKGTPVIELSSETSTGQTHHILPSEILELLKTEPQAYRTAEEHAAIVQKINIATKRHGETNAVAACVMAEVKKLPTFAYHSVKRRWYPDRSNRDREILGISFSAHNRTRWSSLRISHHLDHIDADGVKFMFVDPNVFVKIAAHIESRLK